MVKVLASLEVHKVDRNSVTLAFVADTEIKIDRDEIYSKESETNNSDY